MDEGRHQPHDAGGLDGATPPSRGGRRILLPHRRRSPHRHRQPHHHSNSASIRAARCKSNTWRRLLLIPTHRWLQPTRKHGLHLSRATREVWRQASVRHVRPSSRGCEGCVRTGMHVYGHTHAYGHTHTYRHTPTDHREAQKGERTHTWTHSTRYDAMFGAMFGMREGVETRPVNNVIVVTALL